MDRTNCPNCGAPVTGPSCPYCDTRFENVAGLALGRTVKVSFEHGGYAYEFKVLVDSLSIDADAATDDYYSDGMRVFTAIADPDYRASFSGRVVKDNGGIMVRKLVDDGMLSVNEARGLLYG